VDLVGGERDGVEARGAEAVDRAAGDRDRQVGPEGGLAGDVAAGCAFRVGAAEIDVTSFGSIFARSTACLMAWPPRAAPWVMLNPPRTDFASPVRAVETITASRI